MQSLRRNEATKGWNKPRSETLEMRGMQDPQREVDTRKSVEKSTVTVYKNGLFL
jgi:hypothetical protein